MEEKNKEVLNLENIFFSYDNKAVLADLTLSLKENYIISIIGKSGCGKSTLLNLISGLLIPNSGKIYLLNEKNAFLPNTKISYLKQSTSLLSYRTAFENALTPLELRNELTLSTIDNIRELFVKFGLADSNNLFPNELSGGMHQRVGLIQTISVNANVFLFDEPFNGIDINISSEIANILWKTFKEKKLSAIMITHDLEQAILLSDEIHIMSGAPSKITKSIIFKDEFRQIPPILRKKSSLFTEYLFETVKKFSEI